MTHYTEIDGTPEIKKAIIQKLERDNKISFDADEIIVSCGAKHSLYNVLGAILNPGDEVIIPSPYWPSYIDIVSIHNGIPIILKFSELKDFNIDSLESSITKKTKAIILNSPSNPTGKIYSKNTLKNIAEIVKKKKIFIISDDIYEHIIWKENTHLNILNIDNTLKSQTIIINGVSKCYAMTGWRLGFAAGPKKIVSAMKKLQSQNTSNPSSITQAASVSAFTGNQYFIKKMRNIFKKRHDFLVPELNKLNGFKCQPSQGTFYVFPNIKQAIVNLNLKDDIEFSNFLLKKTYISCVPGSAFGVTGFIRISYTENLKVLKKCLDRLKKILL